LFRISAALRTVISIGSFSDSLPARAGPTASFSMYMSGACRRLPRLATAMTDMALFSPLATSSVPSSGSTATSTSGPFKLPTCSPM